MKALIVDDSIIEIGIIQSILLEAGVVSKAATSGRDIVKVTEEYKPDIILLDLNMPDISGVEVCVRLLASQSTKHVPIIIISGYTDQSTKVEALKAGGVDYITKPFKSETILELVKRYGALGEIMNLCRHLAVPTHELV
jgi:DNA-binding response OmpR family regulator